MPFNYEWQERIKAVEREYIAMRQATDYFRRAAHRDSTILDEDVSYGEIVVAANNLEGTYIIRLFAEFETGARQYWEANWTSIPRMTDLLDGLAARRDVPDPQREAVHRVREYRNSLVHEREDKPEDVSIAEARHFLCHFFSFLPWKW